MKILIVGGGIGGLTLAAFLQGSDVEYEIIEKSKVEQQGYLLVTWDNCRDVLKKLGLSEQFDTKGVPIKNYSIRDGQGKVLRDYNLKDFYVNYGSAVTMLSRSDLQEWLLSKVDGSKIRRELSIQHIAQEDTTVLVTLSNQETREYDAVIGADGIHSTVRDLIFKPNVEKYENWRSWWLWIDNTFNSHDTITEYIEPGEFILLFSAREKTLAVLTAPANHDTWDKAEKRIDRLKKIFKDETSLIPSILDDLKDEEVLPTDLIEVRLKTWVRGRIGLLGDAAHSFGPHAGLGASMAMEDGYTLAGELIQSTQNSIEEALQRYEARRKQRVDIARKLNDRMRLWTLIKSKALRRVVNAIVPYIPESYLVGGYSRLLKEEI